MSELEFRCPLCQRVKNTSVPRDGRAWLEAHFDVFHTNGGLA